jgi:hypothetical protein
MVHSPWRFVNVAVTGLSTGKSFTLWLRKNASFAHGATRLGVHANVAWDMSSSHEPYRKRSRARSRPTAPAAARFSNSREVRYVVGVAAEVAFGVVERLRRHGKIVTRAAASVGTLEHAYAHQIARHCRDRAHVGAREIARADASYPPVHV